MCSCYWAPAAEPCEEALRSNRSEAQTLGCTSAPNPPTIVFDEDDGSQPRLDRELGKCCTVSVSRIHEDESGIFDVKFVALSHNSKYFVRLALRSR
jgi:aspartate-semialdehyde dehydrogenase